MTHHFQKIQASLGRGAKSWFGALALALVLSGPVWFCVGAFAAVQTQAPAKEAPSAPAPGYASPRETLQSFLRDIVRWRETGDGAAMKRAVRALDLSATAVIDRAELGPRYAGDLLELLDKVGVIDPVVLQADAAALAGGTFSQRFARFEPPDVAIDLEFSRVREGEWLIASSTLQRIFEWKQRYGALAAEVKRGKPVTFQEWVRSSVPAPMKRRVALLEAWQWIGFALLIFAGILAQRIATFFFARFVSHIASSDRMALDSKLLARVARPVALLATSIAFFLGVPLLDLEPGAYHVVNLLANIGLTTAVVWTAYRLVDVLSWVMAQKAAATETKFDDMLVPLVRRTLKFVVVILGAVLIITRLNNDLWGLVAGLSIGSLAVGFAAKDSIENLFGTFTVLMDKPFQLGDLILVNGIEGSVEDVGFRSTRVRTGEDSLITIPNSRFIAAHVENRGLRRYRRVRTMLGLTYDTPPEKIVAFCEGIRELIRRHPYTRKSDYHVWLTGYGPSSLDLQLTMFLEVPDWATESRERHRLFLDILRLAESQKVSFAFPTQTVRFERAGGRPAHDDTPEELAGAVERGRADASKIADGSLRYYSGKPPAPIRFDTQDADDAGHGRFEP